MVATSNDFAVACCADNDKEMLFIFDLRASKPTLLRYLDTKDTGSNAWSGWHPDNAHVVGDLMILTDGHGNVFWLRSPFETIHRFPFAVDSIVATTADKDDDAITFYARQHDGVFLVKKFWFGTGSVQDVQTLDVRKVYKGGRELGELSAATQTIWQPMQLLTPRKSYPYQARSIYWNSIAVRSLPLSIFSSCSVKISP